MRTNGYFTLHRYEIPVTKLNETISLLPFGDVHRDSPLCHVEKWKDFLSWAKSKKRALYLGMGDYNDLGSTTERNILLNPALHESSKKSLEDLYKNNTDRFAKEIGFMNGRLIGLIEGNHFSMLSNGTTTTQRLADKLDTKYLGCMSIIRLSFKYGYKRASVDIVAHHGRGAGRLLGSSLNKVQQMAEAVNGNIYLMGDDHKKLTGMCTKLEVQDDKKGGLKLHHKKQIFLRTGSFLKGYEDGQVSYVADGMMNPTDLGTVKVELTPRRDYKNGEDLFYIDLHASI
jgi:hypothetical protein